MAKEIQPEAAKIEEQAAPVAPLRADISAVVDGWFEEFNSTTDPVYAKPLYEKRDDLKARLSKMEH
jgi:hypothetical protein